MNKTLYARYTLAAVLLTFALAGPSVAAKASNETVSDVDLRSEGIRPTGLVLDLGIAAPSKGDAGFLIGINAGLGTLLSRHLDLSLGLRHWSADIDRSSFGTDTPGTFSDTSLDMVLSYPLMKIKGLRPVLGTGLAGHFVGADVAADRSLEDALSGTKFGALMMFGLGTTEPGLGARLQVRRDFVEDVGGWSYTLGVGWWPKVRAGQDQRSVR